MQIAQIERGNNYTGQSPTPKHIFGVFAYIGIALEKAADSAEESGIGHG